MTILSSQHQAKTQLGANLAKYPIPNNLKNPTNPKNGSLGISLKKKRKKLYYHTVLKSKIMSNN